jgi:hypothetical protein
MDTYFCLEILDNNIETLEFIIYVSENATWDLIKRYPNYTILLSRLSRNPNISWEIIRKNPDFPMEISRCFM